MKVKLEEEETKRRQVEEQSQINFKLMEEKEQALREKEDLERLLRAKDQE